MYTLYEKKMIAELNVWKRRMQRDPSLSNMLTMRLQNRINNIIPERVHQAFTLAVKQMTRGVLFGAGFITGTPKVIDTMEGREAAVRDCITVYRNTAAAEGAITGAGGILLGLADFPLWLSLKMKMLFEIAALYGHDTSKLHERIYLLHIFELCFSSGDHRKKVYALLSRWQEHREALPEEIHDFDWRTFQREYRDYLDVAKLLQLIPGIGAPVGAIVNHRLTTKLGKTAMNAYRLRWISELNNRKRITP